MAGTKGGGKAAAATNKRKYGDDFYAKIGAEGGKNGRQGKGFSAHKICKCAEIIGEHKLQQCAGKRGGTASRRTQKQPEDKHLPVAGSYAAKLAEDEERIEIARRAEASVMSFEQPKPKSFFRRIKVGSK